MIFLTGATGQLGRLIIDQLLDVIEADQLGVLVRSEEKGAPFAAKGIAVHVGDYEDPASLAAAFQSVDVLLFTSNADFARRQAQHQNVVNAAKEAGVGRLVYTSIVATDPENPLVASHLATEEAIKASGVPYTFLRNNFYMDMFVDQVQNAIAQGAYRSPLGAGNGAAFVTREDIARMATAVLTTDGHEGKIYNLTGPEVVTPPVIAGAATAVSGKTIPFEQISWDDLAEALKTSGMPDGAVQWSLMFTRILDSNILALVSDDIETVTGTPATSFMNFVKGTLVSD